MVNKQRLRGAYLGRGFNIVSLADEMVMSVPALRARIDRNTLTLRDIDMIEEILGLDIWESDEIFFDGRYSKILANEEKLLAMGLNVGRQPDNSQEPYSEELDPLTDPEETEEDSAYDEEDSEEDSEDK